MNPRQKSIKTDWRGQSRRLCFLCIAWIGFTKDYTSGQNGPTAALAFHPPYLASFSIPKTRIGSHRDERDVAEPNDNFRGAKLEERIGDGREEQEQPIQQRRNFLEQGILAATMLGGISQTTIANAASVDNKLESKYAAAASAQSGIKVSKTAGGLAQRIRGGLCFKMDELQRDLMQERWDLLQPYPAQLRSFVSIFTTYTDAAFPSDSPSDYGLRVALRYEVGRFFASVERLKRAIAKQSLDEAYTAYADMSLHLDRYLRVGGLYTFYDEDIDNEVLFKGYNDALVYSDPVKDPAEVRDLIVLCQGPDKGKTGILIGIYPPTDKSSNVVVKLDKYRGMREIRVVPQSWAAKRLGEQAPDAAFLIPRKA